MSLLACILVLAGGFIGGVARFFVSGMIGQRVGETFPWGTMIVNISGALLIGLLAGAARAHGGVFADTLFWDFAVVGVCGGYTTVSSFCLQTLLLGLDGEHGRAALNVVLSTALCLVAIVIGFGAMTGRFG